MGQERFVARWGEEEQCPGRGGGQSNSRVQVSEQSGHLLQGTVITCCPLQSLVWLAVDHG